MIKTFVKADVAGFVGLPVVFEKANGALCKAERGGDGTIGLVNYGVAGQFKQSSLDTYNADMTSKKKNSDGKGGSFDIVAVYALTPEFDAGDLATALIDGDKEDVLDICELIWKREIVKEVTMADIAKMFGADKITIRG